MSGRRVEHLAQHRRDLDARDVQPEAQVRPSPAEGHVRIGVATDVEPIGVGEDVLVAVGRPVEHDELVAFARSC